MFALDICRDHFKRARAIERHHGVDVVDGRRLEVDEEFGHAGAVQLEKAGGLAAGKNGKRLFIIKRHVFDVDHDAFHFFYAFDGVGKDGKIFNPEKVKFKKADAVFSDGIHVVLGDDFLFTLGIELQRHKFGQSLGRHHHPGGMHGDVTGAAFNLFCHVDDAFAVRVLCIKFLELGHFLDSAVDGHGKALGTHWNQFGNFIADVIGISHGAGHIADRSSGHHCTESSDLGNVFVPIFFTGVLDDFVAAVIGKVHVDIGSRRAFRI